MRYLILSLTMCYHISTQAQLSELDKRNGFKDIKLGMEIDSLQGTKFKKDIKLNNEFPVKVFSVDDPAFSSIGEVHVSNIEVKTYKDHIYQIHVLTDKDTRLMKALESIYGKADYDLKRETYFWKGENLILKFRSHSRSQLELTYTSFIIQKQMKDDKGKKVQAIADDF